MSKAGFDSTELPAVAPRTHCVLISRDPHVIYVYWNFTEQDISRVRHKLKSEGQKLVLRFYNITTPYAWDIEVGFSIKYSYVNVKEDNAEYFAEIGICSSKNHFISLARSKTVRTPSKSTVKRDDLIWQDIKAHKKSQPFIKESPQVKRSHKARTYHLTDQDIRAYYANLFAQLSAKGRSREASSIENILQGKSRGISWQKVHPLISAFELVSKFHPGASVGLLEKKGASENLLKGAGAKPDSFPGASEGRSGKRQFFFEVWTELIVHGRTEPDATVLLNQKGIKLNPDGTFSLRYALPDGEIPLKFIAQSSDKVEQRHIYTRVEREKTISFPKILKEGPHA